MQQPTLLARHIDVAHTKQSLDKVCKKLLSQKIILAWIMKYTMKEYYHYRISYIMRHFILDEEIRVSQTSLHRDNESERIARHDSNHNRELIIGSNTEDSSLTEGTVHYDILFQALLPHTKQTVAMFINVEAQSDYYPGYPLPKRGIYYCCRMISAQYGTIFTDSHYEKIQKVYSVWVCTNPPKHLQYTLSSYEIGKNDRIGVAEEPSSNYDLLSTVILRLGPNPQEPSHRLLDMLSTLLSPHLSAEEKKYRLETEFKIPMTRELKEDINTMCNYSDGVEKMAMKRGWKKGIERGIEQGIEQGTFTTLYNLIKTGLISMEDAAEHVNLSVTAFQNKMKEFQ